MEKKQEIIIHIGMHKTGSTSIQETLAKNSCGNDYTYLNLGAINHNHRIYSLFSDNPTTYYLNKGKTKSEIEDFNNQTKDLFYECVKDLRTPKAIISGEDLINLNEKELSEMDRFLKVFFKKVVVFAYVREPTSYMNSLLQQVIKSGVGFERFIFENSLDNSSKLNLKMLYPKYEETFKKHGKVFGDENLHLKLFDRKKLCEGNVVVDFIKTFNLPISSNLVITDNEGISKPALSIIYALRKASINNVTNISPQILNRITSSLHSLKGDKLALSSKAYKDLIEDNFRDIHWLEKRLSEKLPPPQKTKNGISNEEELVKINKENFLEFNDILENAPIEKSTRNKIIDIIESVCLHGDLIKLNEGSSIDGAFGDLSKRIRPNHESADILREVAYTFEAFGDIDTAFKVMEKAHRLRPKGPFIKQRLEEYRKKLNEKAVAIPPEGIDTINAIGHRDYVGGHWEEIGQLQFDFLVAQGVKPEHTLLDIACGSLRGGVHFINYLFPGNYLGLDKEQELINRGIEHELGKKQEAEKKPEFVISDCFEFGKFSKIPDYAIAQSLFTHLTEEDIRLCLKNLKAFAGDKPLTFFATFFECETPQKGELETSHSHAKFEYTRQQMEQFAKETGWNIEYIGDWNHPRGQKMIKLFKAN